MMTCRRLLLVLFALLAFAGCDDDPGSGPQVTGLVAHGPLAFEMQISFPAPATAQVRYEAPGVAPLTVTSSRSDHPSVPIARLIAETEYTYTVTNDECTCELTGTFTTGALHPTIAGLTFTATGSASFPLTMIQAQHPDYPAFIAVDGLGRVVWYYPTEGSPFAWAQRSNGNLIVNSVEGGVREINALGETVSIMPPDEAIHVHHEIIVRPDDRVWLLQVERQVVDGTLYEGDKIAEWDPEAGTVTELWNSFDYLSPLTDWGPYSSVDDWLHINSLRVGPSGRVLISSPNLNQVIALTPDLSAIEWRLGGVNATIPTDAATAFSFQHTATDLGSNRILLFDNRGAVTLSRGLEINVAMPEATTAWEFRPPNDNYAAIMSSADRLANGNTVISYGPKDGVRDSVGPMEVYEVDPSGAVLYNLVVEGIASFYRATAFDAIGTEAPAP